LLRQLVNRSTNTYILLIIISGFSKEDREEAKKVLFKPDLFPKHKSRANPCYPRQTKYNNRNIKEPMNLIKTC
jgi:hypothetical protein